MDVVSTDAALLTPSSRRIFRNVSVLAAGQLATWLFSLLWAVFVPRSLGPRGMGILVTAWAATGILSIVVSLGTRNLLVKEIAIDPNRAGPLIGAAMLLRIGLIAPMLAIITLYIHLGHFDGYQAVVLYLATGATVFTVLLEPIQAGFQAIERMEYLSISDVLNKSGNAAGAIVLVLLGFGARGVTALYLAMSGFLWLLMVVWSRRYFKIAWRVDLRQIRELLASSFAYWSMGLFYTIYVWIDSVMLSLMTTPTVVGWYGAPTRLYGTLMFIPTIVSMAWLPRLAAAFKAGPDRLRSTARYPLEIVVILSLPVSAGAILIAGPLIRTLYGEGYAASVPVFAILAAAVPLVYLNIMVNQILIATNRQLLWTKVMLGAAIVNPLLNLVLIREFQLRTHNGAIGAAISLLVTEVLVVGVGIAIIREAIEVRPLQRLLRAVVATVAMAVVVVVVRRYGLVVSVLAGVLSFGLLAIILRLPTTEEVLAVQRLVTRIRFRFGPAGVGWP